MPDDHPNEHDDHGGLTRDLPHLVGRRQALRRLGGMSLAGLLAACGVDARGAASTTSSAASTTASSSATTGATSSTTAVLPTTSAAGTPDTSVVADSGAEIPDETAGPFPADGSNGPNVLDEEGVLRADLRPSFGDFTGVADGVATAVVLTVVDADTGTPLPGVVVYLWHCTADGRYSIYEITDENYLRGAQTADAAGRVTFTTVFPGCYTGRWPHCHFEIYPSLDEATAGSSAIKVSQLALPQADCEMVYADARYGNSANNLSRLSLSTDGVFRDGWADQLAVVSGSVADGMTASLLVRV